MLKCGEGTEGLKGIGDVCGVYTGGGVGARGVYIVGGPEYGPIAVSPAYGFGPAIDARYRGVTRAGGRDRRVDVERPGHPGAGGQGGEEGGPSLGGQARRLREAADPAVAIRCRR